MNSRSLMRKFVQTRNALDETMKRILDINRRRKSFFAKSDDTVRDRLDEELKVLNATANIQARVLQRYASQLEKSQRA